MPTRRTLNGVLCGFLSTYTSRYSDYDGYWLFGFLVMNPQAFEFDLLRKVEAQNSPLNYARRLAQTRFHDQLLKHGLHVSCVRDARLFVASLPEEVEGMAGDRKRLGHNMRFQASALADYGRRFELEQVVFVAPYDASVERRSGRPTSVTRACAAVASAAEAQAAGAVSGGDVRV